MTTLKATFNGNSYFKNGLRMFVYFLTGTAAAIAEYKTAKATRLGIPEGELKTDDAGNQLYHLAMFPGAVAKKTLTIGITQSGRIVIDDAAEAMAKSQRIDALTEVEEAKAIVARKYGERTLAVRTTSTVSTQGDSNDEFEIAAQSLQQKESVVKSEGVESLAD